MTLKEPKPIHYDRLAELTDRIPFGLDVHKKKEPITKETRLKMYARDGGICYVCKIKGEYGARTPYVNTPGRHNLHHIIPNGKANEANLVTLCQHCHNIVHLILYVEGKWRYSRV